MKILVTGSVGHLGEALMRTLASSQHQAAGIDLKPSPFTHYVVSICDRSFVDRCMGGVQSVLHTATLHKPHIETHSAREFIDTNVSAPVLGWQPRPRYDFGSVLQQLRSGEEYRSPLARAVGSKSYARAPGIYSAK